MSASALFRFDAAEHMYVDLATGEEIPHITSMLSRTGWINDEWFTEESCERGTAVHELTASFDLGALDMESCQSRYRGWLLSHVAAMRIMKPQILSVEEPLVHPILRFGGRPDRHMKAWGLHAVLEGKSGPPAKSHQIQTALQCILLAPTAKLPPEAMARFALYWEENGKFRLIEHTDKRDLDVAYEVIKACCRSFG